MCFELDESLCEKTYSFIKKMRSNEYALTPTFISASLFSIGICFQIAEIALGNSGYYFASYVPFFLIILFTVGIGFPYPFKSNDSFLYDLFENESIKRDSIVNFLVCCLIPGPFFISVIIYVSREDSYLAIVFQMLGILFVMSSFLFWLIIFNLELPDQDDVEL
jgi:hypothetical protein